MIAWFALFSGAISWILIALLAVSTCLPLLKHLRSRRTGARAGA